MPAGLDAAPAAQARGDIVVALDEADPALSRDAGASLRADLAARFAGTTATLVDATDDVVRALLEEADRLGARAAVLVRAEPRDERIDWPGLLVGPVVESGFDWVGAAYRRHKLEGMLNTAIVHPLLRALFGKRLRQPCTGEVALSLGLVRALLDGPDRRRFGDSGPEAWLAATALAGRWRVGQAWLGPWRGPRGPRDDASHALARAVAPVFDEMARHADRWQRREGSDEIPSFGEPGLEDGGPPANVDALEDAFRLGLRELGPLWGQVLPPGTVLALRRAAAAAQARFADEIWARVVYDFALAFSLRTVERQQLLRSMTPIYLGWVAGFARDVRALDAATTEARVESLCEAFEREKPYAISRWRWPDGFNP
jgi:glucosylglycerate synthase